MWRNFFKFLLRIQGWSVKGTQPKHLRKYVLISSPHTSGWDVYYGLMVRESLGLKTNFLAKKELFKFPFGWLFKWVGGIPLDRTGGLNNVDASVKIFNEKEDFVLTIAPEGTRKYTPAFRTGFYYIALGAKVPIVMVAMDFEHKCFILSEPFYPTGNLEEDTKVFKSFFAGVKGKHPNDGTYSNV